MMKKTVQLVVTKIETLTMTKIKTPAMTTILRIRVWRTTRESPMKKRMTMKKKIGSKKEIWRRLPK
jgi:hypothetical protein